MPKYRCLLSGMGQEGQLVGPIPTCAKEKKRKVVTLTSIKKETTRALSNLGEKD
jgi:hypothetical protein